MNRSKQIWLSLSTSNHRNRLIRKGVWHFARPAHPWLFSGGTENLTPQIIEARRPYDGAIGELGRADLSAAAAKCPYPFVNIYGGDPVGGPPQVGTDDRAIGRMAAEFFMGRGFENFAFAGFSWRGGETPGRLEGYREALAGRDRTPRVYLPNGLNPMEDDPEAPTHKWLAGLPKPVAIFCTNDSLCRWLCEVCLHLGISVPDEVSLLGVDNAENVCEESYPPSSSIELPCAEVGHEAAKILERMMRGEKPPSQPLLLQPKGVVERKSTDTLCLSDPKVNKAVVYIRENLLLPRADTLATRAITPREVAHKVRASRRGLDDRFRKALRRTVFGQIRHEQLDRIKLRLRETDMSIDAIARETGFDDGNCLYQAFKRDEKIPPGTYRKQFRRM